MVKFAALPGANEALPEIVPVRTTSARYSARQNGTEHTMIPLDSVVSPNSAAAGPGTHFNGFILHSCWAVRRDIAQDRRWKPGTSSMNWYRAVYNRWAGIIPGAEGWRTVLWYLPSLSHGLLVLAALYEAGLFPCGDSCDLLGFWAHCWPYGLVD